MEDQLNENMSTFVLVQGELGGSKSVCPKESNENYDGGDCDDGDDNNENCYIPYEYHVFLVKNFFQEVIIG